MYYNCNIPRSRRVIHFLILKVFAKTPFAEKLWYLQFIRGCFTSNFELQVYAGLECVWAMHAILAMLWNAERDPKLCFSAQVIQVISFIVQIQLLGTFGDHRDPEWFPMCSPSHFNQSYNVLRVFHGQVHFAALTTVWFMVQFCKWESWVAGSCCISHFWEHQTLLLLGVACASFC